MKLLPIQMKFLKLTLDKTHLDIDGLRELLFQNFTSEHLTTLHIYNLSYRSVFSNSFSSPIDKRVTNMTLKRLVMDEIRVQTPQFMSSFFKTFVNLEEIVLQCDKRSDWEEMKGIWKEHSPLHSSVIQGLFQYCQEFPENILRLRSFSCGILDLSHFEKLTHLGTKSQLRLCSLEMYCPAKDVSSESLKEFLETQKNSLEILRILGNIEKLRRAVGQKKKDETEKCFLLELPQKMSCLKELQLSGRDKDTPIPLLRAFNYGLQFPSLRTLIINGFASNIPECNMWDYFPGGTLISKSRTLKKLVIPAELKDPEFPLRLSNLFPNLVDLELKYPNDSFLASVFRNLLVLQRLKIFAEGANSIEEAFLEGTIHQLSKLSSLEIIVETRHREIPKALTDSIANQVLRNMKNLRKLGLLSCCWYDGPIPCNYISLKSQQDLTRALDSCAIIFDPNEEKTKTVCPKPNHNVGLNATSLTIQSASRDPINCKIE